MGCGAFLARLNLRILVDKQLYIFNTPIAIVYWLWVALTCGGFLLLAYLNNAYMGPVTPNGYPNLSVSKAADSVMNAAYVSERASLPECGQDHMQRTYKQLADGVSFVGGGGTWHACPGVAEYQELNVASQFDMVMVPTTAHYQYTAHNADSTKCTALHTKYTTDVACGNSASTRDDLLDKYCGETISESDTTYCNMAFEGMQGYLVGVESVLVNLGATYSLIDKNSGTMYSGSTNYAASEGTKFATGIAVLVYDEATASWVDAPCLGETTCYFPAGSQTPQVPMSDLLAMVGVNLDEPNTGGIVNLRAGETVTGGSGASYTLPQYPTFRQSGVQLNIECEFRGETLYMANVAGAKSGTSMYYLKVTLVPDAMTTYSTTSFVDGDVRDYSTGEQWISTYTGIRISYTMSPDSAFAFLSYTALVALLASLIVIFNSATLVIKFFAIKPLGNTSRDYRRIQRTPANVRQSAKTSVPIRMFQTANCFFQLAQLERMGSQANQIVPGWTESQTSPMNERSPIDHVCLEKSTIEGLLRAIFSSVSEIDEGEMEMMVHKIWSRLKGNNEMVHLDEFAMSATLGDPIDFISLKRTYDEEREQGCLERIFGDSIQFGVTTDQDEEDQKAALVARHRDGEAGDDDGNDSLSTVSNAIQGTTGMVITGIGMSVRTGTAVLG